MKYLVRASKDGNFNITELDRNGKMRSMDFTPLDFYNSNMQRIRKGNMYDFSFVAKDALCISFEGSSEKDNTFILDESVLDNPLLMCIFESIADSFHKGEELETNKLDAICLEIIAKYAETKDAEFLNGYSNLTEIKRYMRINAESLFQRADWSRVVDVKKSFGLLEFGRFTVILLAVNKVLSWLFSTPISILAHGLVSVAIYYVCDCGRYQRKYQKKEKCHALLDELIEVLEEKSEIEQNLIKSYENEKRDERMRILYSFIQRDLKYIESHKESDFQTECEELAKLSDEAKIVYSDKSLRSLLNIEKRIYAKGVRDNSLNEPQFSWTSSFDKLCHYLLGRNISIDDEVLNNARYLLEMIDEKRTPNGEMVAVEILEAVMECLCTFKANKDPASTYNQKIATNYDKLKKCYRWAVSIIYTDEGEQMSSSPKRIYSINRDQEGQACAVTPRAWYPSKTIKLEQKGWPK